MFKAEIYIDGILDKLKVRLVARDFSQIYGVDFIDTFTPTIKFDTLRLFLVIIILGNLEYY